MFTVSNNTPSAGCIQWINLGIQYNGVGYSITNGYTNAAYVYWLASSPTVLVASNTYPALGNDDCLVFLNKNGVALVAPGSTALDGGLIVPGTILADAIAANTITGDKISAGAISANNLAADCVGANAIAAGAVLAEHISAGVVTADKLAAGAVTAAKIGANQVTAEKIASGTITGAKIASGSITSEKIAAGAVIAAKIAAGTITSDKLASNVGSSLNLTSNTAITSLVSSVEGITIGGRNLLLDSGREIVSALGVYSIGAYTPVEPLIAGETYTISLCVTPGTGVTNFSAGVSTGWKRLAYFTVSGTGRQILTCTFAAAYYDGMTPQDDLIYARINIYRFPNNGTVTGETVIHWIKVEKGNKATDWTPAPEDITAIADRAQLNAEIAQATANNTQAQFQRITRLDAAGLHVKDNVNPGSEVLIDTGSVSIVTSGDMTAKFAGSYIQFGNYRLRRTADGGLSFRLM